MNRRSFLHQTSLLGLAAAAPRLRAADAAANKVKVAVVALGRGMAHVQALLKLPGVEIKYLAETDPVRLERGLKIVADAQEVSCHGVKDFRTFLDDPELDAVFIATPNFWHTPAAVMALQAGKHVYVEKPGSQNAGEAELLVMAAQKSGKLVQMGNQRRTWMKESIEALHGGAIGTVRFGRGFYYNTRKETGALAQPAPAGLDWDLWQGPVPDEPGRDLKKFAHYDWHWLWHWGNGELGNNGIHALDLCRWGLQVEYPVRVVSAGGRYRFEDDQQTPDTHNVVFEFAERKSITWDGLSCNRHSQDFVTFYGETGAMVVDGGGNCRFYNELNKVSEEIKGNQGDVEHIADFVAAIRNDTPLKLNQEILEGHKSTLLCHLGNIAHRTGRTLKCDAGNGHVVGDEDAMKLWGRDYEKGWEPTV